MENIIAVVWDFDKTLVKGYMQDPIFEEYQVDAKSFWRENDDMVEEYSRKDILMNKDTAYLNLFIRYAKSGRFAGLDNAKLATYGPKQSFYDGIPEIFKTTKSLLDADPLCKEYNIRVEHYIVSTGFRKVIQNSSISEYIEHVWGCDLIDGLDEQGRPVISEIGFTIDNTSKTRALFEINKGVHKNEGVEVNMKLTEDQKRVAFKNMIYIADGPSDIPAFSVVKSRGGSTFAIYPKHDNRAFKQVEQMREDGRIDMFAEADYSDGTTASMWICNKIREKAERIKEEEKSKRTGITCAPIHLI
ncbi:MAG: haloacid dehalogenase-like hydrolase [Bacteroidales bacterium]|nr:haloacid dehalogenase-like hydrolase [Bacteroidales bacterium]